MAEQAKQEARQPSPDAADRSAWLLMPPGRTGRNQAGAGQCRSADATVFAPDSQIVVEAYEPGSTLPEIGPHADLRRPMPRNRVFSGDLLYRSVRRARVMTAR